MRFKISPEVVRLIAMVTAFVQTVGASLALAAPGAVPATVVLVLVAVGGGLQAALVAYGQGIQTNPPDGMLTEERAAELSEERKPAPAEPHPWPAEYTERWPSERVKPAATATDPYAVGPYAAGRAPVRESPPTPDE